MDKGSIWNALEVERKAFSERHDYYVLRWWEGTHRALIPPERKVKKRTDQKAWRPNGMKGGRSGN